MTEYIIASIFGILYIVGWIASYFETSVSQEPFGWRKVRQIIMLFFIWWYIAFAMARLGDK